MSLLIVLGWQVRGLFSFCHFPYLEILDFSYISSLVGYEHISNAMIMLLLLKAIESVGPKLLANILRSSKYKVCNIFTHFPFLWQLRRTSLTSLTLHHYSCQENP